MNLISNRLAPPQHPQIAFGRKPGIVVDEPIFPKTGVERPHLRVGVPTDEENRLSSTPGYGRTFFLQSLQHLFRKVL